VIAPKDSGGEAFEAATLLEALAEALPSQERRAARAA
jgi:hypothetical protein